jgi:hydroxymethylglutaryl-CoA lyase
VLREIERVPGVVYSALVPNVRGAERAIDAQADEMNLVMSASESHNLANLRMTREQSLCAALAEVAALARQAGVAGQRVALVQLRLPDGRRGRESDVFAWCGRFIEESARRASRCATPPAWPTRGRSRTWCANSSRAGPAPT